MELLTYIYRIDDLRWIPTVSETIFDSCEIAREIESCSILLLEDTRREFCFFRENYPNTSIFIRSCYSLLDKFFYDIFHIPLEIWVIFIVWTREVESFIEALTDVIVSMNIEEVEFFLDFSYRNSSESLPEFDVFRISFREFFEFFTSSKIPFFSY